MVNNPGKKIAKNTLMLYFRMLLSMVVTLYTSRVVLNTLGVQDFGIYNVVGGIVIMLGFLNYAMTASTQRFLTFEIGKNDMLQLKKVFSMSTTIHAIISLVVLVLAETIGLWFLNSYLHIPHARMYAANWVYQFSIFSFIVTVLSVPYNAAIIANEKMNVYAYVGVFEVTLKLMLVFLLVFMPYDKLITYSLLLFIVSIILRIIEGTYCKRNFEESKNYKFIWDKALFKSLGNFASWNLLGVSAGIGYNQGVNILLNIFFGPTINAARGIAF
ncbi:MAG: lipopolysaccharide biosynthesis protein, partial [Mucilaginibacter sp.]